MKISVIAEDKVIAKDNIVLQFDFTIPSDIHAIQWDTDKGHIEYIDEEIDNFPFTDFSIIEPYSVAFDNEQQRINDEYYGTTPAEQLSQAKIHKKDAIKVQRSQYLNDATVTWTVYTFAADPESRVNLSNIVTQLNAGETLPADFTWRTIDDQDLSINEAGLKALLKLMVDNTFHIFKRSWIAKSQVDVATTVEEVDAVEYTI